jgi:hypothetical protein
MRESQQLFFGLWLVRRIFEELQHPAIQTKTVQHFGGFFHQIKVCQPIGRKDSIQAICQRMRGLVAFLHLASLNFELFSKIQDKTKSIAILRIIRPIYVNVEVKAEESCLSFFFKILQYFLISV